MEQFRNGNQMKSFMKKEASRLNISITNTYTTFLSRLFLEKLSKYNSENLLIKGSAAETAYLGKLVRGITDVDIAVVGSFEIYKKFVDSIIENEQSGCIGFSILREPKRTYTGIYKTSLLTTFDKMKHPISVDVQEKYNRLIEKDNYKMPCIFEGDEEFDIVVPSFEEYLAEKLCIVVESNKPNVLNTRVKDFYDIYQLHGGKYNPEKLSEYFKKMLLLRGKVSIDSASTEYLDRNFVLNHSSIWDSTKEKYDFLDSEIDLFGAVYYTRAVLREELQKNGSLIPDSVFKNSK